MEVLAHYLEIEWESAGATRRVEVSTYPIEIETTPDGTLHAEVSIFRDFAPWVGLQLSGDFAEIQPCTVNAQNERLPWLQVFDEHGSAWWIPATGWSKASSKHVSEMQRSFGSFSVELGPRNLVLDALALDLDRAHAQEYLDDFQDELIWLAIGRPTGALGEVGSNYSRDLVDALEEFADAARHVLEHPAREIREMTTSVPAARVRPNSETFRAVMRRPGARTYPGRTAHESADVPENRYVRSMVERCRRLARSVARSSDRHRVHLAARAMREKARATALLAIEGIDVDREIFANQLSDIRRRIDAIADWAGTSIRPLSGEQLYRFSVGNEFKSNKMGTREFYYRNLERNSLHGEPKDIDFSVVRLPDELHELVKAAHALDKNLALTITGKANVTTFPTKFKKGRRATFTHISHVQSHSPVLERREAARSRYERDGWHRSIVGKEREEYRAEARTALARASHFEDRVQEGIISSFGLNNVANSLDRQDAGWDRLCVPPNSVFPMGMRFVQNPTYAAALAAFQRVSTLEQRTGLSGDTLDKLGRINTLHASALYERWCLIKIIAVVVQDFGFAPQADWVEHLVTSVSQADKSNNTGFTLRFTRSHPSMTACLDAEPLLANGRRPDFRLRFTIGPNAKSHDAADVSASNHRRTALRELTQRTTGLVMDAKFRTRWKQDELLSMLRLLVDTKAYGQDGDRVFILQPARDVIEHRTSPLAWSRDCDYGQEHPTSHAHGSIQLAADQFTGGASMINLRRLIALELQKVFPEPEIDASNGGSVGGHEAQRAGPTEICRSTVSFCINCGEAHEPADVTPDRTDRGNRKWYYKCSRCGSGTMQTRCFGCGTFLHKNGLQMTYHLTVADQISNVVCHDCGAGF